MPGAWPSCFFPHNIISDIDFKITQNQTKPKKKKKRKDIESLLWYSAHAPLLKVVLKMITLATRGRGMKIYRT